MRRGGKSASGREPQSEIPIIDAERRIVGWTRESPSFMGAFMHHPEAERLLSGAVHCMYVQIADPAAAARAGAPPDWRHDWRCLGICSDNLMAAVNRADSPTIEVGPRLGRAAKRIGH